jgi:hypothetical protein|nr:MAG TPA: hypothetical protein [Caudoviricetes sp.]
MIWRGQADGQTVEADDGRGEAGTQGRRDAGRRLHHAPIWAGAGGLLLSDEADRMTASADGGRTLHYMIEIASGCWAIMPQIMPRRS